MAIIGCSSLVQEFFVRAVTCGVGSGNLAKCSILLAVPVLTMTEHWGGDSLDYRI